MKSCFALSIMLLTPLFIFAQDNNLPTDHSGEDQRAWIKSNWYNNHQNISTSTSAGYRDARLEMYNNIDPIDSVLYGFYSAYSVDVPSSGFSTPGDISPMNCEHIVPQSVFNSAGPMKNDIHHLAPTYGNWNSTRGSLPFGDIDDLATDKWMRFDDQISCSNSDECLPDAEIRDDFSEFVANGRWEPREEVKGNVARAVFYFYTMYPQFRIENIADIAELYTWHMEDLPDAEEIERNNEVESFQGNRNPFIDFPEWVASAWLDAAATGSFELSTLEMEVFPSPATHAIYLETSNYPVTITILDIDGRQRHTEKIRFDGQAISVDYLPIGMYYVKMELASNELGYCSFIKN